MKKWVPFKSLTEQQKLLKQVKDDKEKTDKPELSDSQIEDVNNALTNYCGETVTVRFYIDGHIRETIGILDKIDPVYQIIKINSMTIEFKNLISIE